jgi:hypothetical protein
MTYEKPRLVVISGKDAMWARGQGCAVGSAASLECTNGNAATGVECKVGPGATGKCKAGVGT